METTKHQEAMKILHTLLEKRWCTQKLDEWSYSFQYLSGSIPFNCYMEINPEMKSVLFRAILGGAPLELAFYDNMERLCTIHNVKLPNGCLAFNPENGEVRFKTSSYFWSMELTEQMIRNVVEPSLMLLDSCVLSIVSVHSGGSLNEALTLIGEDPGIGTNNLCHYKYEPHPRAS